MTQITSFQTGDKFFMPWNPEYAEDIFTVTRTRKYMEGTILDGVCDGDDSISISISIPASQVERA